MAALPEQIGDYKVVRELGRGAMGVVYLAIHPSLGREMALKVMAPELARDPEFVERFRREGEAAARLRHPNIVQVFDFAHRDGLYFIAMEYLGGRTLKDLLEEEGQQPVGTACRMLDELLAALSVAHAKGIIHRDIKPANVMVTDEGPVALTDFSIARMKDSSKLTQTGAVVGTPEYMAPEQFDGVWDARSDLYAAAIVFYELLTGLSPFRSATMTEVMRKQLLLVPDTPSLVDYTISEEVSQVVSRGLEKDPAARYQTAEEMRQAIRQALREALPQPGSDVPTPPGSIGKTKEAESPACLEPSPPSAGASSPPEPAAPLPPGLALTATGSPQTPDPPPVVPKLTSLRAQAPPAVIGPEPTNVAVPPALSAPEPTDVPSPPAPPAPTALSAPGPTNVPAPPASEPASPPAYIPAARPEPLGASWTSRQKLGLAILVLAFGLGVWSIREAQKSSGQPDPPAVSSSPAPATPTAPEPQPAPAPTTPVAPPPAPVPAPKQSKFPSKGYIAPGLGIGDVGLGMGKAKVRKLWGEPSEGQSKNGLTQWQYGGRGGAGKCIVAFNKKNVVEAIAVVTPDFVIAGDPNCRVGANYETVLATYPNPSLATEAALDYRNQGLLFLFAEGRCQYLLIYGRGRDITQLQLLK